jgi:Na+-transporting methylmalonyl-CoA/oxaloacetate decarboxylase gamma subunit
MDPEFLQGLAISAIGMGMVFGALAMLWAIIVVLTRLSLPGQASGEEHPEILAELHPSRPVAAPSQDELAAIGAVLALLRAERTAEMSLRRRLPPVLTRWVAVGYGRQLEPWRPPRAGRSQPPTTKPPDKP